MQAMPTQRRALQGLGGVDSPPAHGQRRPAVHPLRSSRPGRREGAAAARNEARGADLSFSAPRSRVF